MTGSNTTCRGHIRSHHYEFYSKKCKEKGIEEVERCIPAEVLRARRDSCQSKTLTQSKLNLTAESVPKEFSQEAIIHATTMLVACNNLVRVSRSVTARTLSLNSPHRPSNSPISQPTITAS